MAKSDLRKQKARLIAGIFVLVVIVLALVSTSLAWFLTGKETEVHTFELRTDSAYNLQISPTNKDNWTYELQFNDEKQLRPVTGNGVDFFTPVFGMTEKTEGSGVYFSSPTGYESIAPELLSDYVFPIDFKVQIESDCDLLIEQFFVEMPRGVNNTNFETAGSGVEQAGLLGAIRIAVLEKTEDGYTPCFFWVPDQEVALRMNREGKYVIEAHSEGDFEDFILQNDTALEESTVVTAPQTNFPDNTISGSGLVETEDGPKVRFGGAREEITEGRTSFARINCYFDPAQAGTDNRLAQLKGKEEKEFRIVVWIDGNDGECNNVLMGGEIHVGMKLGIDHVA